LGESVDGWDRGKRIREGLACEDVDCRVRFRGGLGQRRRGGEDVVWIKVLVLSNLPDGGFHPPKGGRRYDGGGGVWDLTYLTVGSK
jgi:hypothetical protein